MKFKALFGLLAAGLMATSAANATELEVTHRSLNDQTIEGICHREVKAFSVQYHPEASAGPHDSHYLFQHFLEILKEEAPCNSAPAS